MRRGPWKLLADADPLQEKADIELVRHADAAVHLDRLLGGEGRDGAGACLGDRRDGAGVVEILIERFCDTPGERRQQIDPKAHIAGLDDHGALGGFCDQVFVCG